MKNEEYSFPKIHELLQWNNHDLFVTELKMIRRDHLNFLTKRIVNVINQKDAGDEIIDQLFDLPQQSLIRILRAPETCHIIYRYQSCSKEMIKYLSSKIKAEKYLNDRTVEFSESLWTALGDYKMSFEDKDVKLHEQQTIHSLLVDTESPYYSYTLVPSNFRPIFGTPAPFSAAEYSKVITEIEKSMDALLSSDLPAYALCRYMISSIMPRKDPKNPTYKGSSNRGIIGRINLINPHNDDVNYTVLASSIVHESLHVFLYHHEEQSPLVPDDIGYSAMLESPWSEKRIHLRAYIHASFIWFALYHLFTHKKSEGLFTNDEVQYFLELTSRGFEKNQMIDRLFRHQSSIDSKVFEELEKIQLIMSN